MSRRPDLSLRPYKLCVARIMAAPPTVLYAAWTENFDQWAAEPGTVLMRPKAGEPFFFETQFEGQRHPHYGRFLQLIPNQLIELTWVTSDPGTKGAETVITVELSPQDDGTRLTLTHAGFADEQSMLEHEQSWPEALAHLDQCMMEQDKG